MKLRIALPMVVLVALLAGCSSPPSGGTDPGTDSGTGVDGSTDGGATAVEPWSECPGIVDRLNANEEDPTTYEQVGAADFPAQEVGADVLAAACVIRVTVNDQPITWAILPGDADLAVSISSTVASTGFTPTGSGLFANESTGVGLYIQSFGSGAELDAFLVYSTAFSSVGVPMVYVGSFAL